MEFFQGLEFANDVVRGGRRFFNWFHANGLRNLPIYCGAYDAHDGRDQETNEGDEGEERDDGLRIVGGIADLRGGAVD